MKRYQRLICSYFFAGCVGKPANLLALLAQAAQGPKAAPSANNFAPIQDSFHRFIVVGSGPIGGLPKHSELQLRLLQPEPARFR